MVKLPGQDITNWSAATSEGHRRVRTSAAMIGLAISMSATGMLLPQQENQAIASESIPVEPTFTLKPTASQKPETVVLPSTLVSENQQEAKKQPFKVEPAPPVFKHQIQEGETLWQLSQEYAVEPEAIAASNQIKPDATLQVGQSLKIPSVTGVVHQVKPKETVETIATSYGVKAEQVKSSVTAAPSEELESGESITIAGDVDSLLKNRQDAALSTLQEKREQLNSSLSTLTLPKANGQPTAEAVQEIPVVLEESQESNAIASSKANQSKSVQIPVTLADHSSLPVPAESQNEMEAIATPIPSPEVAVSPTPRPSQEDNAIPLPVLPLNGAVSEEQNTVESEDMAIPLPKPNVAVSPFPQPNTKETESIELPVFSTETPSSLTLENGEASQKQVEIEIDVDAETETASETPSETIIPQPIVLTPQTITVYQVKPGDTIDAIARVYDISREDLIEVNQISDPNLIKVNQQLRIPGIQTARNFNRPTTLIPGLAPSFDSGRSSTKSTFSLNDDIRQDLLANEALSEEQEFPSTRGSSRPTSQPSLSISEEENLVVNAEEVSEAERYVNQLKTEVERLRLEYNQSNKEPEPETDQSLTIEPPTEQVNPEWQSDRTAIEISVDNTDNSEVTEVQQPIALTVEPPSFSQPSPQAVTPPKPRLSAPQQDVVAAAPISVEQYNPAFQTPVGETVAPSIPPLAPADQYLPDSPQPFNGYIWPAKGVLTSGYGWRWGRMHKGIDIAAPVGTPIFSAAPGVVVSSGWNSGGYGNLVKIQHPDGSLTLYAHNHRNLVQKGQQVEQGQQIAEMGSTGYSTGPHLHFEVHPSGKGAVNPMAFLPKRN
ncbi:MAG: peptidoglycan DD-metalloendopeptidase family protein [Cyanobacteriota bacterium]